eukprot:3812364-Pleurochrysis_carterae.AAC.2
MLASIAHGAPRRTRIISFSARKSYRSRRLLTALALLLGTSEATLLGSLALASREKRNRYGMWIARLLANHRISHLNSLAFAQARVVAILDGVVTTARKSACNLRPARSQFANTLCDDAIFLLGPVVPCGTGLMLDSRPGRQHAH